MLFEFLKQNHECKHTHIPLDADEAYCPDCGALVHNKWYIIRCSCCNIKRSSHLEYNEIKPDTKYCQNCGGTDFYIQKFDKINLTDINYAILKKEVISQKRVYSKQIWIEKEEQLLAENKIIGYLI